MRIYYVTFCPAGVRMAGIPAAAYNVAAPQQPNFEHALQQLKTAGSVASWHTISNTDSNTERNPKS